MILTPDQIRELAERIVGSVDSLSDVLDHLFDLDEDDLTLDDHLALDNQVFTCDTCGWWHFTEELVKGSTCEDCCRGRQL